MSAASSIAVSEVQGVHLHLKSLLANYPALTQDADDACWNMLSQAKLVSFDAHSILFHEAMECKHLMLIVEGKVRVYKNSPEGREVTLYRVEPGELCVHNLNNLVNGLSYPIMAQTETAMQGLVITRPIFQKALAESVSFRNYVLRTLTERLSHMVDLVSGFAFDRLDLRIACWLNHQYEQNCGKPIKITHSELAQELGTTREMVSRILKDFEHKRCIQLARGKIHLQCRHTLKMVTEGKGKSA
ncbi:MAG: Crp/Fnr family transcriptional regulator [Thioalkalispiraceae bacterium]|jgi:CRP/FNR family transcriptional regulator